MTLPPLLWKQLSPMPEDRDSADYAEAGWELKQSSAALDYWNGLKAPRCGKCGHTAGSHTMSRCGSYYLDPVERCDCEGYGEAVSE